jgi:hypothetical protein
MDEEQLVDEEEVYRFFGGCLPIVKHNRMLFLKIIRVTGWTKGKRMLKPIKANNKSYRD